MAAKEIDVIQSGGEVLACIIRGDAPDRTTFLTAPDFPLQVGYVARSAGDAIPRHVHRPVPRHIDATSEVLVVQKGRCLVDIYGRDRALVTSREVAAGDILLLIAGGHGFRIAEDTVFLEIKQGPYAGLDEKERF